MEQNKKVIENKENEKKEQKREQAKKVSRISQDGFIKLAFIDKEQKANFKILIDSIIATIDNDFYKFNSIACSRFVKFSNEQFNELLTMCDTITTSNTALYYEKDGARVLFVRDIIKVKQILGVAILDIVKNNKNFVLGASWYAIAKQFNKLYFATLKEQNAKDSLKLAQLQLEKEEEKEKEKEKKQEQKKNTKKKK